MTNELMRKDLHMVMMKGRFERKIAPVVFGLCSLFVMGVVSANVAEAETDTFTNVAYSSSTDFDYTQSPLWSDVGNWCDERGLNPAFPPTNGEDVVFAPTPENVSRRMVYTGPVFGTDGSVYISGTGSVDPSVASLSGDCHYVIKHGSNEGKWRYSLLRPFTVENPNAFKGYWELGDYKSCISLPGTLSSEFVPRLESVYAGVRGFVDVPKAETTAEIGDLYGRGVIQKTGAGTLEIGGTDGVQTDVVIADGTLVVRGRNVDDSDGLEALLRQSVVHLDPSVASTLQVTNGDHYAFVTNWMDVRTNGFAAIASKFAKPGDSNFMSYTIPGYIAEERSPTGLPLVSFGSPCTLPGYGFNPAYDPSFGPTNCCLELAFNGSTRELQGVEEVFYVVRYARAARAATLFNGDGTYLAFMSDAWSMFNSYSVKGVIPVLRGEFRKNGELWAPDQYKSNTLNAMTNAFVGNAALASPTMISAFGTDRHYMARTGGSRLGEVLFFTNKLTRAERQRINSYLYDKWIAGETGEYDVGNVYYQQSASGIGVPAGRKAAVRNLVTDQPTIRKTGDGRLDVENVLGTDDVSFDVHGGEVGFVRNSGTVNPSEPAKNPYLWLDASKNVMTITSDLAAGMNFVSSWKDCRENVSLSASSPGTVSSSTKWTLPTYVEFGGVKVVDFGRKWDAELYERSTMRFPNSGKRDVYAAFVVLRPLCPNGNANLNLFGSTSIDTYRQVEYQRLMGRYVSNPYVMAATWTVDGVPTDPHEIRPSLADTNKFMVVGLSADEPFQHDGLACTHGGVESSLNGSCQIAESIVYRRPLSERERRDTEAYLMEKWLKKSHPEEVFAKKRIRGLTFAESIPVAIGSDSTTMVSSVLGGNGTLIKTGEGVLELDTCTNGIRIVRVEGGELRTTFGFSPSAASVFHFDANDGATIDSYDVGSSAPKETYVTEWRDCRQNGLWARPVVSYDPYGRNGYGIAVTNPVLRHVETADGIDRRAVDFGPGRHFYATTTDHEPPHGEAPMEWNQRLMASEVYTLFANHTNVITKVNARYLHGSGQIIGHAYDCHFVRNWGSFNLFYRELSAGAGKNSLCFSDIEGETTTWLDGEIVAPNTSVSDGLFHLVAVASSNAVPGEVSAFALERNLSCGGVLIGEQIGFTRWLNDEERAYVTSKLLRKWFGEDAAEKVLLPYALDSLYVAPSSSFVDTEEVSLSASVVSGGGLIQVDELTGVERFVLEGRMTIDGALDCKNEAIAVNIVSGFDLREPGLYPIITAHEVKNADLSKWTLAGPALSSRCSNVLEFDASGNVCVRVEKRGLFLIIR